VESDIFGMPMPADGGVETAMEALDGKETPLVTGGPVLNTKPLPASAAPCLDPGLVLVEIRLLVCEDASERETERDGRPAGSLSDSREDSAPSSAEPDERPFMGKMLPKQSWLTRTEMWELARGKTLTIKLELGPIQNTAVRLDKKAS
jgi:hypothetical protein